ncbi:MAG: DUF547 domain-containing protein [Deltaproteobacteria bacterium]|nr:DUF547 domain-containing protein [Deltaproteobacteria bacterium]
MKRLTKKSIRLIMGLLVLIATMGNHTAIADAGVDHGIFGELLKKYIVNGGVDYRGFKSEEKRLDAYLRQLETVQVDSLGRNEQFAFYTNSYNAWTIKLILGGYPGVKSIKDLGSLFKSPWKKKFVKINGETLTLDDIEHNILRPQFKDPRVHFAINCASKSCPPLAASPYTGGTLDAQLDAATIAFINDPGKNRLEGSVLYVSKIFNWFSGDFNDDVLSFFLKYSDRTLKADLTRKGDDITIQYLDYDWSLNGS